MFLNGFSVAQAILVQDQRLFIILIKGLDGVTFSVFVSQQHLEGRVALFAGAPQ